MRIMQQKQARDQQQSTTLTTEMSNDLNLYAPNPFGGLHGPVPVSSGESDQTYNLGVRTEYGGLQQNLVGAVQNIAQVPAKPQNPHSTNNSHFIAVQDSEHGSSLKVMQPSPAQLSPNKNS